jgi:hypothetical protein
MNRLPVRDLVVVSALAVLARVLAALPVDYAPYTDPAYYQLVAERLAIGEGFTVPVIWSFLEVGGRLPPDPHLPVPSNGHWMPLSSIVSAASMWLFGPSWRAAQLPHIVLSAGLVPLTYLVAWRFWRERWVAWISAILAIFAGPLFIYYPLVENFAVFGAAGAGSIYLAMRAVSIERPGVYLVASGALAGLATLARVDGLLILAAPLTAWAIRRGWIGRRTDAPRVPALAAVGILLAAAVVMAPWLVRQTLTFGAPFPSAGGQTLWITSYNQQFSIGDEVSLASYLAWGPFNIIGSKLESWFELLGRTAVLLGGTFFFTFVPGLWMSRRRPELAPFIVYWVAMFAVMGAVFTFHAPRGAFYHSAPAWLPFAIPLAVASLAPVATAIGRFWRFLRRPATHRFLAVVGTAGAIVLSSIGSGVIYAEWDRSHRLDVAAATWLSDRGDPDAVVMYSDPATLALLSGNPGVAAPFDPFAVTERVIDAYAVRWVVVQLAPGAETDALDLWPGRAGTDVDGDRATFLADTPVFEVPDGIRIFEVIRP